MLSSPLSSPRSYIPDLGTNLAFDPNDLPGSLQSPSSKDGSKLDVELDHLTHLEEGITSPELSPGMRRVVPRNENVEVSPPRPSPSTSFLLSPTFNHSIHQGAKCRRATVGDSLSWQRTGDSLKPTVLNVKRIIS